jgi:hypothetical protein
VSASDPVEKIAARKLERVRRCFDGVGRLQRWPNKRAEQVLVSWVVWSMLPEGTRFSEAEINTMLGGWHDLGDQALLRRELVDLGLLQRTPTGSIYRRANPPVPDDAAASLSAEAANSAMAAAAAD